MFGKRRKNKGKPKGAAPKANPTNIVESIGKLKGSQNKLEKRVEFLRKKANRHLMLAKKANQEGKKDDALMNLRRKKIFEKEIKTLESSILTIEEQVLKIEGGSAVHDVYQALQLAKSAMNVVTKGVTADDLDELMADIRDKNADLDELQELLGESAIDTYDDADLLAELDDLDGERVENIAFNDLKLPDPVKDKDEDEALLRELRKSSAELAELAGLVAPTHVPVMKKPEEEDELAALEAAMLA